MVMVSLVPFISALPLSVDRFNAADTEDAFVDDQNNELERDNTGQQLDSAENDDLETSQVVFRPLFVYRKSVAQRYNNIRRSDNYQGIPNKRRCPYHYYYY